MVKSRALLMVGAALCALVTGRAHAQDVPALAGLTPDRAAEVKQLIAGAKAEGNVISAFDGVVQPSTNDELVKGFRKYYGIPDFKVNYTLTSTSNIVTRAQQELSAHHVTIDIVCVAAVSWAFEHAKSGDLVEYHSPEYAHYTKSFAAGLGKDGFFAFNGAYTFVPMWNADDLDFKGKSYEDVINAVPVGRINHGDAAHSPTYLATYMGEKTVLPPEFFTKLAAMKPVFIVRSEQIAGNLITGEQQMAFSGMPSRAYQNNQKGAHLKFIFPTEGIVLLPQSMMMLKGLPHPNGAKLWIDYVLSEEGQEIIAKGEALISGRDGFKSPLPEYSPAIDQLKVIKIDWRKISTADMEAARKEWGAIYNP